MHVCLHVHVRSENQMLASFQKTLEKRGKSLVSTFVYMGNGFESKYYIVWIIRLSLSLSIYHYLYLYLYLCLFVYDHNAIYKSKFLARHEWNFDTSNRRAWVFETSCDRVPKPGSSNYIVITTSVKSARSLAIFVLISIQCAQEDRSIRLTGCRDVLLIELTSSRWVYRDLRFRQFPANLSLVWIVQMAFEKLYS